VDLGDSAEADAVEQFGTEIDSDDIPSAIACFSLNAAPA